MNREIKPWQFRYLFRGKDKGNVWRYGNLHVDEVGQTHEIVDFTCRHMSCFYPVIPVTVGQYTGLLDKNGNKVFEGDVIDKKYKWAVVFIDGAFWGKRQRTVELLDHIIKKRLQAKCPVEIIGNKWDNPELLEDDKRGDVPQDRRR